MDNQRPALELKRFRDIYQYSDRNGESSWKLVTICTPKSIAFEVPIIALFTKYDQFLRNVGIDLEDCNYDDPSIDASKEAKEKAAQKIFEEHFLGPLGDGIPWVQMRGGFGIEYRNNVLIFLDSHGQTRGTL